MYSAEGHAVIFESVLIGEQVTIRGVKIRTAICMDMYAKIVAQARVECRVLRPFKWFKLAVWEIDVKSYYTCT